MPRGLWLLGFYLMFSVCVAGAPGGADANEIGEDVRTICSQSQQGLYLFSECLSSIAYLDARTSEVYYCNGDHLVVTKGTVVERVTLNAECVLSFRPFRGAGNYTLFDITKNLIPSLPASKSNLYPDGVAWVASGTARDIQFCSQFLAGMAGTQSKCVAATFK